MWFSLALTLVKIAFSVFQWLRDRQLIKQGEDIAMARAAKALLEATAAGKLLREEVARLPEKEANDLWDRMVK